MDEFEVIPDGSETCPMTTIVKTDKSWLTIPGFIDGQYYVVRQQSGGWFITPEKTHRVKRKGMSAEAFAKIYRARVPLDAATAKEISANLVANNLAHPVTRS